MNLKTGTLVLLFAFLVAGQPLLGQERLASAVPRSKAESGASVLDVTAGLKVEGVSLGSALTQLGFTSGVRFAFSPSLLPGEHLVNCDCEAITVREALDRLLAGTGLRYTLLGKQVIVEQGPHLEQMKVQLAAVDLIPTTPRTLEGGVNGGVVRMLPQQEPGNIQGSVVDVTNQRPLQNAQVFLPGLERGVLTDARGRFLLLNIPAGEHQIRVDLIGYAAAERTVTVTSGTTTTVNFQIQPAAISMDELVVTGVAAETPRAKVPFVVERIRDMPVPSISGVGAMIQGKVAGVQVVSASGMPGDETSILLRGPTSIMGSSDPLIIVDGIILSSGTVDIEALDIESIEVVKGAAAASFYGSRAAAGVIQITTRRGHDMVEDRTRFILRTEYGQSQLEGRITTAQYHPFRLNAAGTAFVDAAGQEVDYAGAILDGPDLNRTFQDKAYPIPTFDHLDRFFNPGRSLTNYVAAEGRSGQMNYHVSFGDLREQGVLKGHDGFRRQNARLNLDLGRGGPISLGLTGSFSRSHQDDVNMESRTSPFGRLSFMAPVADLMERDPETGRIKVAPDPRGSALNPLYQVFYNDRYNERQRILGGASLRYSPVEWFNLEGNLSYDRTDQSRYNYFPRGYETSETGVSTGSLSRSTYEIEGINSSLTAGINRRFGELSTRIRVRYLYEDETYDFFSSYGANFLVEDLPSLSATSDGFSVSSSQTTVRSEGYFFISDFDFRDRYVGSFLVRRDGSSLFGPDARWQTYYRASGAYRMSLEPWWPVPGIDEFRLRYSLGTAGGRPSFAAQYETYTIAAGALRPMTLGNRELRPEFSTEHEFGIDINALNRIGFSLTHARSVNENQLLQIPLRAYAGFSTQWRNAGTIESNTWEASLEGTLLNRPDTYWSARLNFDRTRQNITDWPRSELRYGPFSSFYYREGEALGSFYGFRWAQSCADLPGVPCDSRQFQVNDDGYLVWVGEGNTWRDGMAKNLWGTSGEVGGTAFQWGMPIRAYDETGNDLFILGNTQPDFSLSFSSDFRWRNLSLFALFGAEVGTDIYNMTRQWAVRDFRHAEVDQYGKPDETKKPMGYFERLYDRRNINSHYVEDGSYLKLRELALRYSFGRSQLDRLFGEWAGGVERVTLSLIGRNLKTWTDYTGYDPEVGPSYTGVGVEPRASVWARFDNYQYPNFRTFRTMVEVVF